MRVLCVIPARIGSTRLPHKPLRLLGGRPLIWHTARAARQAGVFAEVVIATDDRRVVQAVAGLGVHAVLTGPAENGTARVAQTIRRAAYRSFDWIVNVQGDEPFVPPGALRGVVDGLVAGHALATAATQFGPEGRGGPDAPRVFVNSDGTARWFSRSDTPEQDVSGCAVLRHLGVYGYGRAALERWAASPPSGAELAERLEQLRPLSAGETMWVACVQDPAPAGVDTPADLDRAERWYRHTRNQVRV